MDKIKDSLEGRRRDLVDKYKNKIEHLAALREEEKREKLETIPSGLEKYSRCKIFNREKMCEMKPQNITHKLIGEIKIDEDEKRVLDLNPKFAVMKKLQQIEMEQDIELGLGKIRYELTRLNKKRRDEEIEETNYGIRRERKRMKIEERIKEEEDEIMEDAKSRQIFDPITLKFNYSKKRATDLKENKSVSLPKGVDEKLESELSILKEMMLKEFRAYKQELEKKESNVDENKKRNQ